MHIKHLPLISYNNLIFNSLVYKYFLPFVKDESKFVFNKIAMFCLYMIRVFQAVHGMDYMLSINCAYCVLGTNVVVKS